LDVPTSFVKKIMEVGKVSADWVMRFLSS
jgi:hypothetical protein